MAAYGSAYYKYYVHYHALTYVTQEHQAKNFPFETYARRVMTRRANALRSQRNDAVKKRYLQSINAVMGRKTGTENFDVNLIAEQQQIIDDALKHKLENKLVYLDPESGAAFKDTSTAKTVQAKNVNPNQQKIAVSEQRMKKILHEAKRIRGQMEKIAQSSTLTTPPPTLEELNTVIAEMEKEIAQMRTLCTIDENGKKIYEKNFAALHSADTKWALLPAENNNWLTRINQLLKEYQAYHKTATDIQGAYFEQVLASAGRVSVGEAYKQLYQNIARTIGSDKQKMEFTVDGMPYSIWAQTFLGKDLAHTSISNNVTVVTKEKYSQGKVDVEVWLSPEEQQQGLKPVRVSAKSYASLKEFSAVSGTSLWTLLQDENSIFIKAYLNVMAKREAIAEQRVFGSVAMEANAIQTLFRQRHYAVTAMKMIAAYKALTGDVLGRQAAQLFIINDVKNQKIYLAEMGDLFQYIFTEIAERRSSIDYFFNFHDTLNEAWTYHNNWAATQDLRLATVLQEAHEHKLRVMFTNAESLLQNPKITLSIDKNGNIT